MNFLSLEITKIASENPITIVCFIFYLFVVAWINIILVDEIIIKPEIYRLITERIIIFSSTNNNLPYLPKNLGRIKTAKRSFCLKKCYKYSIGVKP